MAAALDGLSWACLVAGSVFLLLGGLGLLRFPDFYARMHAAGLTDTAAAGLIVVGLMLQTDFDLVTAKLALILILYFFTSPTSSHATGRAALAAGLRPLLMHDLTRQPAADEQKDARS